MTTQKLDLRFAGSAEEKHRRNRNPRYKGSGEAVGGGGVGVKRQLFNQMPHSAERGLKCTTAYLLLRPRFSNQQVSSKRRAKVSLLLGLFCVLMRMQSDSISEVGGFRPASTLLCSRPTCINERNMRPLTSAFCVGQRAREACSASAGF